MIDRSARETDRIRSYFRNTSWRQTPAREWLVAERRAVVERLVEESLPPLDQLTICDVGCGGGGDLAWWHALGVPADRLYGTELSRESAAAAREAVPRANIAVVDGFGLPFADGSFDVVTASLVISSIRDAAGRRTLLTEMRRVTRAGGLLTVYDFRVRKPWNPNVVAIGGAELARVVGRPGAAYRVSPLLPALDVVLKAPRPLRGRLIRCLPRTHRLWIWLGVTTPQARRAG